ncbi:MAG: ABC transporter substrate-binding protein [Bacteroidales bacterium]|nr:ABC transporter substrate-binding protein [Bacteroidales bacterium]
MKKGIFIFFLCLAVCSSCNERKKEASKTVFRYNEAANITSLDPAFARDQAIIWATNQLFNGLVQLDDQLIIRPCIARSWEISADGRLYTFHLRTDVFFHQSPAFGKLKTRRVTAADFVYSFNRIVDPSVASPGAWIFNNVKQTGSRFHFIAINDSTFSLELKRTFPPFLSLLSMQYCSVIPQEAIRFFGSRFRSNPVGTGPFMIKMWKEGVKLVLLKNPDYFEFDDSTRLPYLDAVAITFLPDKQSAFLEFVKGNLDFMSGIDPTYKDELLTPSGKLQPKYEKEISLITQPYLNTEYLGFLVNQENPTTSKSERVNKPIRQAINYAFDREKMIRYLRNNIGTPGLQGITPKGLPSFDSSRIFYHYDPEKARALLASAGYPGGRGLPAITLTSTSDYLDICKYLQHQVAGLGINLEIEVSPPAAVKEMKAQAKLPFFRASWIADYPDAENYLSLFYSKNFCPRGPNYTHFSNPGFDRLYERAMSTIDDPTRYAMYREMESIIMEEAPVVILYYDQVLRFIRKDVKGMGNNPMNLLTLKRVRKL